MNFDNVKRLLPYFGIILIVSLVQYSLSLDNYFVWDAHMAFTDDPSVRDLKNLPLSFQEPIFNQNQSSEGGDFGQMNYYRPLTKILHILEYPFFGTDPFGYKAVNVILNAAVVLMLFVVVFSATNNPAVALVAALLYAVNPTRAEAVYWTYSDSYILMGFFSLVSLALYQQRHIILALIAFLLSLFCHEMAVLLPVIILLYTFLIDQERSFRAYVPSLLYFALVGGFLILRTAVVGPVPLGGVEIGTFLNTAVVVIQRYTKMFFLPDAPVTVYDNQLYGSLTLEVIISYAVVVLLAAFGVWLWFRRRTYLFWYLWFFVWLSVNLNIVEVGEYHLMAEKILYLACAGFCVLLALLVVEFEHRKAIVYGLLGCLAIFHSATTFSRDVYWQDTRTYFHKALEFAPDSIVIRYVLGCDYVKTREYDKAFAQLEKVVAINPGFSHAYNEMGNIYVEKKEYDRALELYRQAVAINPDFTQPYNSMGNIYYLWNDMDLAIRAWKKSITSDPGNPMPYYNIGLALKKKGDLSGALFYFEKYLTIVSQPEPRAVSQINELRSVVKQ